MDLNSERLNYKKLTKADAPTYITMALNPDVMRYITGRGLTEQEAYERFESMIGTNNKIAEIGFYKVSDKKDNTFIGLGKLVFIHGNTAEIGYSLLPRFWGRKYASEMAGCFIRHAVNIPYIHELVAVVNPDNTASKQLLLKHGFTWFETGFVNELPTEIHRLQLQNKKK